MEPVDLVIRESRGVNRLDYIVEQGVPIHPLEEKEVDLLAIFDENGNAVPASIQVEAVDQNGLVRWLLVSFALDLNKGEERRFILKKTENRPQPTSRLGISEFSANNFVFTNRFFTLELSNPGIMKLTTDSGVVADGNINFELRSDARSTVGGLRLAHYEPKGFKILERTERRAKILLKGIYRAWAPKNYYLDDIQRYEVDLELTVYADSPVIRLKWCITDFMRFNCSYMWLDRYLLKIPFFANGDSIDGIKSPNGNFFEYWAAVETPGAKLAAAFPMQDWFGKGSGIEVVNGEMAIGGVNPPPDGGFGGKSPDIYRKFFYGMSRTFEASLIIGGSESQVQSELKKLPIILDPQYYSKTGALPESGSIVTNGPWTDQINRTAEYLLDSQWKGTLWYGEWWRERDIDHDLGIEETNSGNSALGPLYHFYRTGDWRFWESAKMSFYYTYDIQFCKQTDGYGPYMHTRRFLLDHQEWFHPRYQRVGGMIRCSHFFGDRVYRDKVIWLLRYWGENYVADDGAPMVPNPDGTKSKCTESAMSNFADSLMYAYQETGDGWYLEKAKLIGDWVVRGAEADLDKFCENSNSTRYILRGLLNLCKETGDKRYIDTFVKIAKWTVNAPTFEYGTHYVAFHFYYAAQAYKWSGDIEILKGILKLAKWVLSMESKESPGTYPFLQRYQSPPARWICIYDNKAIVSYLPVLASTLAEAGINPESEN